MSDQIDKDESKHIDALYQSRKRRYQSPDAIKTEMLNKLAHSQPQQTPWWKVDFSQYFKISALAITGALAFLVVSMQLINQQQKNTELVSLSPNDYLSIQFHVLDGSDTPNNLPAQSTNTPHGVLANNESSNNLPIANNATQRKINYQQALDGLETKQTERVLHHQTYASVVKSDSGLSLITCEQELIQISQEVMDLLFPGKTKKSIDFESGNMIALGFDDNGHIIEMREQVLKSQC
jgi:hypothetical protein